MIRVSDYIAQRLARHGVRHVFLVTGGGAMHLNDAFGREPGLSLLPCHHEQACATAAEAYYRLTNRLACVNVTTGPGGTNAITGVYGAYTDSIGMIVISGQVRYDTVVRSTVLPLRQLGDQELDITPMVASITKYAVMVTDPKTIRYHLERALHLATSGRPGPVWLDIPMNVQGAMIDPETLTGYDPAEDAQETPTTDLAAVAKQVLDKLAAAERPVIMVGTGVRLAGAAETFLKAAEKLGVPVVTAFNAHDLVPDDHPLYVGRPGTVGDRPGNFAVQSADFLLVLGCRLNIRQISYNWAAFARHAYTVMVDIDPVEMQKPTLKIDLPVHADAKAFLEALLAAHPAAPTTAHQQYLAWCRERRERYPVVQAEYWQATDRINPYCFGDALFKQLPERAIVVTGDGTACVTSFQSATIKAGTRLFSNSGSAPMGYDVPAAIGACVATTDPTTGKRERVFCLAGDGSLMMNLQELQTIATHQLPVTIFLYNNGGYHSIRQTQQAYFPDNPVGYDAASGVGFPDFARLAAAFDMPYFRLETHADLERGLQAVLGATGPVFCEVMLDIDQPFSPKLSSRRLEDGRMVSSPLEDLAPFLSREELADNVLVPLVEDIR